MTRTFEPSIWTFIWYLTVNLPLQIFLKQWFNHQYHQIVIKKKQVLPSIDWNMINVHFPIKTLSFAFSDIKRGSPPASKDLLGHENTFHLSSDPQTMWKGHSSMTLATKIVPSSPEGKWKLLLPAIILENRLFSLHWLLMKIAQAIKFTIPFTWCIQIKTCIVDGKGGGGGLHEEKTGWKSENAHLCQHWDLFVVDSFKWKLWRNMMFTKDALADISSYWGYLKADGTETLSRGKIR